MKGVVRVAVPLLVLAACVDAPSPVALPNDAALAATEDAPLMAVSAAAGTPIPGEYIVVMKPSAAMRTTSAAQAVGVAAGRVRRTYRAALDGFTASLSEGEAAALARHPNVALVERDQVMTISTTQSGATWGLDRIDQRNLSTT